MNVAQKLVECLAAEGVEYIFGIPGEENLEVIEAIAESPIRFITTRHEQGAAFMADVSLRLQQLQSFDEVCIRHTSAEDIGNFDTLKEKPFLRSDRRCSSRNGRLRGKRKRPFGNSSVCLNGMIRLKHGEKSEETIDPSGN